MKNIKTLVVDTSVILKPILKEDGEEKVKKMNYLKDNYELSILIPDIFRYEFMNIVGRGLETQTAENAFLAFTERQVSIIPLDTDLMGIAAKIKNQYPKVSFYDAAYHALAKAYNTDFITADRRYYEQTKKEGNIKLLKDLKL